MSKKMLFFRKVIALSDALSNAIVQIVCWWKKSLKNQ